MPQDLPELIRADRAHLWHPRSQQRSWAAADPLILTSASGCWVTDIHGRRRIDATSGRGTAVFGHGHPQVRRAIEEQLKQLSHHSLQSASHIPALRLAERLAGIAPWGLQRCFFGASRSDTVEAAMKICWQVQQARGRPARQRFAVLGQAHHGDSLGALSLAGDDPAHEMFEPLLNEPVLLAAPRSAGDSTVFLLKRALADLEAAAPHLAALFVEPLCVGRQWHMHPPSWLRTLLERARELDVVLVVDEARSSLGRTCATFAVDTVGVAPDLLLLSDGLTNGTLPLGVVLATDTIYETLQGDRRATQQLAHVEHWAGNPLSCAAALATLDLLEQGQVLDWATALTQQIALLAPRLANTPGVRQVRTTGVLVAVELDLPSSHPDSATGEAGAVVNAAREAGALLHAEGTTLLLQPPLCTPDDALVELFDITTQAIRTVLSP